MKEEKKKESAVNSGFKAILHHSFSLWFHKGNEASWDQGNLQELANAYQAMAIIFIFICHYYSITSFSFFVAVKYYLEEKGSVISHRFYKANLSHRLLQ